MIHEPNRYFTEQMKTIFLIFLLLFIGFTSKGFSLNRKTEKQCDKQENCLTTHDETKSNTRTEQDTTKGQLVLHLSLPYINNFHLNPANEGIKNNTGFMGYAIGLDYYHRSNQYLIFSFSQIQDFFLPIMFVDRGDEYELMSSYVFNLSNNHMVNHFSLGYRLVFSKNSWELRNLFGDENSSTRKPVKKATMH